jgi:hypothetical protein
MTPVPRATNALLCQEVCSENQNCKIFYWTGHICYNADHLFKGENNFTEEEQSIIGQSNCSLPEKIWSNSIFIQRPSKDVTPFIIGSVLAIILIATIIAMMVFRAKQKTKVSIPSSMAKLMSKDEDEVNMETMKPGNFFIK